MDLYSELRKLAKRANQRLVRLERAFGKDKFSSIDLRNRLDTELVKGWTKSGRIRYNKSLTEEQMLAIIKATQDFLDDSKSTVRGIKKYANKKIADIKSKYGDVDIDYSDIATLDEVSDSSLKSLYYSLVDPSVGVRFINYAISKNLSFDKFVNELETIMDVENDWLLNEKLKQIYNKFVASGTGL